MKWEDIKRKLSSRKFWVCLAGFVTALLYALNWAESDITQAVSVISAAGVLIAYLLAEGNIDAARAGKEDNSDADISGQE